MAGGIIDRFRSLDVPGTSVLAGHVTASLLRNVISTALVTAVAFGIGFRPHSSVAAFAAALGVLLLFVAALSWLAAAFGLLVSAPEAATPVTETIRGLLLHQPADVRLGAALAWCLGIMAASIAICALLYRRRTA
jgi:ABC-2 type transport system permease protein